MADFFDFDSLTQSNSDPFEDSTSYVSEVDTRFYTLPKNKDGSGEAIICFIPDQNQKIFKKVFKFNISNFVSGKKRFANYFSPTTKLLVWLTLTYYVVLELTLTFILALRLVWVWKDLQC